MIKLRRLPFLALLLPFCAVLHGQAVKEDVPKEIEFLKQGQAALRAKDYKIAIGALGQAVAEKGKLADEALYLRSLAFYYGKVYGHAIESCDTLLKDFPESSWRHKARFLKAAAYVQQRDYKNAEAIYEAEADRLLDAGRKQDVAGVIIHFADELATVPAKDDLSAPPPNFNKAAKLYEKALAMEIGRELRDEVTYKKARAYHQAKNIGQASREYQLYLAEFDPDWSGPVGSPNRTAGLKKDNPPPAGKYPLQTRFFLAKAQNEQRILVHARTNAEDLLTLVGEKGLVENEAQLVADTRWLIVQSYSMPAVQGNILELGLKAARDFLRQHKDDPRSVYAAWWIAEAYRNQGRADDAIAAYWDFLQLKNHALPKGDALTASVPGYKESPAKIQSDYEKSGLYQIAQIRFGQKKYAEATEAWQSYINKYPDGPQWSACQRGIINASYQIAMDAVEAKEYKKAQGLFEKFLADNPLDNRASKILYLFGQIAYNDAGELDCKCNQEDLPAEGKPSEEEVDAAYAKAIAIWKRLASKYPRTEEASNALYQIGVIQEEKFGDWKAALETYKQINFGSKARNARTRVGLMTKTSLGLQTDKVFRSDEQPVVRLATRNIKKVTVKQYFLDLEAYFRKTHAIANVDHLDVALIEPDKTWEVEVEDYGDYRPIEQDIEVPYDDCQVGACLINVSDENFEATSIVIRSDIDLILKSSRREALVFVEDRRLTAPATGVKILLSDGKKVFATGETGEDGVYRGKLDELKDTNSLRAFAIADGHIASNLVSLEGLGFSSGLAPKGYLYVDRPAYQPGETVKIRGILRDVKDGSYVVPAGKAYVVSVTDPSGKLLWEAEKVPGKFGTFHTSVQIDRLAQVGNYTLSARQKDDPAKSFSSQFTVQKFQLEKIRLKIESEQSVYFRGEKIELSVTAEYYWGQPLAGKQVTYYLPDGRQLAGNTDEQGKLEFEYDTTGNQAGSALAFQVSLDGENVRGTHQVFLAREGFYANVRPSRKLVLAGEPFDVTIGTLSPDGEPVGKELTLFVLRRTAGKPNPILRALPWHGGGTAPMEETTIGEHPFKTEEEDGKGTVNLTLEEGGEYVLRVAGQDRFGQTVTSETTVKISGDEDDTKLRFFSESDVLQVGADANLRLHSRIDGRLALLTFEGEEILEHRVIKLSKGFKDIPLPISHQHFPNFSTCINAMDGKKLHVAQKPFRVERQLNVKVTPKKETYAPGDEAEVGIEVTDQLGKPVEAELSLALVNEALYTIYPDASPEIRQFFEQDAKRHADFRIGSSTGFNYVATTRKVIKEFLDEKDRVERRRRETESLRRAAVQLEARQMAMQPNASSQTFRGMPQEAQQTINAPTDLNMQISGQMFQQLKDLDHAQFRYGVNAAEGNIVVDGRQQFTGDGGGGGGTATGGTMVFFNGSGAIDQLGRNWHFTSSLDNNGDADGDGPLGSQLLQGDATIRRETTGDSFWLPAIVTDADGKATAKLPLPASTSEWRITSKGISVDTLAGQAQAKVITRKEFFVSMKAPAQLQEGDSIQVLARVHNLTDFEGATALTLKLFGGEEFDQLLAERAGEVEVGKQGVEEFLFESVTIPSAANLRMEIEVEADGKVVDTLSKTFPIRPWGLEFADHDGGTSDGDAKAFVSLPEDRRDGSQWMSVTVGPAIHRSIFDMALGHAVTPWVQGGENRQYWLAPPRRIGGFGGSDLLAVVAALEFARKSAAPIDETARLENRALALVGSVVSSQRSDGGWSWRNNQSGSHWGITATTFRALCAARDAKLPVHAEAIWKAKQFLQKSFTSFSANNNDHKAVVLYALSVDGAADFAHANRLYRERNTMSPASLACTALAFVNLDRKEFAGEILDLLATKLEIHENKGKELVRCPGVRSNSWYLEETETSALAALAFMKGKPGSEKIEPLVQYLLARRGAYGFSAAKARGPAIEALAHYYAEGKAAEDDYELTILVNGKELKKLKVNGATRSQAFAVPAELLADGENVVDFRMNGRGEYVYAATLRGFSKNLKDPKSWSYPYVRYKRYYHMPLKYRGKPIRAGSSTQVQNLEIGQRVRVSVDLYHYSSSRDYRGYMVVEEHLPAGTILAEGTLGGNHRYHEIDGNKITLYYPIGQTPNDFTYQLIAYATGEYRVLPIILRDTVNPGRMRVGPSKTLNVLAPGEESPDPYSLNDGERYTLGQLNFNDGNYAAALQYLAYLRKNNPKYNEKDVCRMLLWIYTSQGQYDAEKIIGVFEVLRERYPALEIPYDKILTVGRAYRDLGEWERAYLVFKATIDASLVNEVNVSAVLEDEGLFLGSIDYQEDLWREYPDTAQVTNMYFSISQALYLKAPKAHELEKERDVAILRGGKPVRQGKRKPEKVAMLRETIRLLTSFLTLHPESTLADDAAFSMANALLDLKMHDLVIQLCKRYKQRFQDSEFSGGYQYMVALGHFWKNNYQDALEAAGVVAESDSKDRDFARYIIGQIHHAEGSPGKAIEWYTKVKDKYADAKQAIDYFEQRHIRLDEIHTFQPGEDVGVKLQYRNIKDAYLQVYKVDLMKLYLREKNLSKITSVSLAGIAPLIEAEVPLGDGKDYVDKEKTAALDLKDPGAYLVICRGDDLYASSLVLVTPLKIEIQEDATSGRVRANVRDISSDKYVAGVHVKAIGSNDKTFKSGETDLRGIYIADDLNGTSTVIARDSENQYAFYRGETHLGKKPENNNRPAPQQSETDAQAAPQYRGNLDVLNDRIQKSNWGGYDSFRRATNKGVQIMHVK